MNIPNQTQMKMEEQLKFTERRRSDILREMKLCL